jgi:hypothetical protein
MMIITVYDNKKDRIEIRSDFLSNILCEKPKTKIRSAQQATNDDGHYSV